MLFIFYFLWRVLWSTWKNIWGVANINALLLINIVLILQILVCIVVFQLPVLLEKEQQAWIMMVAVSASLYTEAVDQLVYRAIPGETTAGWLLVDWSCRPLHNSPCARSTIYALTAMTIIYFMKRALLLISCMLR